MPDLLWPVADLLETIMVIVMVTTTAFTVRRLRDRYEERLFRMEADHRHQMAQLSETVDVLTRRLIDLDQDVTGLSNRLAMHVTDYPDTLEKILTDRGEDQMPRKYRGQGMSRVELLAEELDGEPSPR